MITRLLSTAAVGVCILASSANAQVPLLHNPGFELTYTGFETFAAGWRQHQTGQTLRRTIGDGLLPDAEVRRGVASAILPGGEPCPTCDPVQNVFQAVQSEEFIDATHRNWPQYTFDPVNGTPIYISCWFMIPASDPMVGTKFGIKVNFLRNAPGNQSIYREREWLDVDPDTSITPFCGTTVVSIPQPDPLPPLNGIHTNGEWVKMSVSVNQQTDFNDPGTGQTYGVPPTNPAPASIFALRFGTVSSTGTVWVDDIRFSQTPPCDADYDGDDELAVADIFAFLNGWFAGNCRADFNKVNGLEIADIFAFLNSWFAGCP